MARAKIIEQARLERIVRKAMKRIRRPRSRYDDRPLWSDPDLPAITAGSLPNGTQLPGCSKQEMEQYAKGHILIYHPKMPRWRHDPTY